MGGFAELNDLCNYNRNVCYCYVLFYIYISY